MIAWLNAQQGGGTARKDDPGRVTARRLNRQEYNNTVRDLLGIDFRPADDFPADDSGYGFDNIGDVLSISPVLMEKYMAAAEVIAERAIVAEQYLEPALEKYLAPRTPEDKGLIKFSREGSMKVTHDFPRDADYIIEVRAVDRRRTPEPTPEDPDPALPVPLPFEFTIDGERVKVFNIQSQYAGQRAERSYHHAPQGSP